VVGKGFPQLRGVATHNKELQRFRFGFLLAVVDGGPLLAGCRSRTRCAQGPDLTGYRPLRNETRCRAAKGRFAWRDQPTNVSFHFLAMTAMGTQEPPGQSEVERLQTEWTGRWLCICQQAGFCLNPPLRVNHDRHPGQSQLYAGLLPFKFSGCPAAGCPQETFVVSVLQRQVSEENCRTERGLTENYSAGAVIRG